MAGKLTTVLVGCGGISVAWLGAAKEIVGLIDLPAYRRSGKSPKRSVLPLTQLPGGWEFCAPERRVTKSVSVRMYN